MNPQTQYPNQNPAQPVQPVQPTMPQAPAYTQPAAQPMAQPATQQPAQVQYPQPAAQPIQPTMQQIQQPVQQAYPQPTQQPQPVYQAQGAQPVSPIANAPAAQPAQPATKPAAPAQTDAPLSTQSTLLISELRDGLVIMKDGSFRAVVACQSINFDLMSESEREAVEFSYQNFLNSLTFNVQILVRSQRVDIGPYIERLSEIRRNNDNMLLGVLMDDYINFIDILSQEANIMDKSFFIVIPYYTSADAEKVLTQTKNIFSAFSKSKAPEVTKIDRATYDKAISEINNRVESVISGLYQIGIRSVRLNTRELGALYYNFNNPDTAVREPLVDFTKLATTYVKKGEKNA